ncbi:hypothetical protein PIB30_060235 [Stylosanthes scabra]|uniref:Uncharacterized protein n=1 Tax=Stylosanthes scabra TaxID=79078 RepID=A0ABU6WIZ6_9FABA|nr:hypothetical protein [Stylosanthes scabra]
MVTCVFHFPVWTGNRTPKLIGGISWYLPQTAYHYQVPEAKFLSREAFLKHNNLVTVELSPCPQDYRFKQWNKAHGFFDCCAAADVRPSPCELDSKITSKVLGHPSKLWVNSWQKFKTLHHTFLPKVIVMAPLTMLKMFLKYKC